MQSTGQCKGRGQYESWLPEVNNMGCNGIVGGGHGLSTGAALASKDEKDRKCCCLLYGWKSIKWREVFMNV